MIDPRDRSGAELRHRHFFPRRGEGSIATCFAEGSKNKKKKKQVVPCVAGARLLWLAGALLGWLLAAGAFVCGRTETQPPARRAAAAEAFREERG
eukprot:scaffold7102_cov247-Pinguiococcus_pyrenoidosus.AAC.1